MMKKSIFYIAIAFCGQLGACGSAQTLTQQPSLVSDFLDKCATTNPQIVAEGFISTAHSERDFTISPDGNEIYYTLVAPKGNFQVILRLHKQNGKWSMPEVASFSGKYPDIEPAFSPDGKRLYFASQRPLDEKGTPKDWDIWYVEKTTSGWSKAIHAGDSVNTVADEFYPSITNDGSLYFTAQYADKGTGKEDIFKAKMENGVFRKPENIGEGVNSKLYEFNAFVAPDESYIIFTGYGRADDMGGGDLYISFRNEAGQWKEAIHLGKEINSPFLDYCPYISPDKKVFFYTSEKRATKTPFFETPQTYQNLMQNFNSAQNGQGNIYSIKADLILGLKK